MSRKTGDINGTDILSKMMRSVSNDQLNRRGLLVDRLRQVSAKLDDIERKIAKANSDRAIKLKDLLARIEADRLGLIAMMNDGRYVQPTTRSTARVIKTELERKQGRAYSRDEMYGAVTMGTGKALP